MHEQSTRGEGQTASGTAQVPTGIPGLDRLLDGGLREGGLHVVLGGPGTGKSVLAHQIGANVVRAGGKVLYLTALVETHQTLLSQARTFRFFDAGMVPGSFYYASLYPVLGKGGLAGVREEISRLVANQNPSLVILDGVHALKTAAQEPLEYQRFVHELEAQAAVTGMTTLLLAHPSLEGIASDPTFTIADAIFHVRTRTLRLRHIRMFSVGKLRGVDHIGGWHTFRITAEGIHIFPRIETLAEKAEPSLAGGGAGLPAGDLAEVSVRGLNKMLGGGLDRASTTLVVGTPGSGKTLFGLAFLHSGLEGDEPGLFFGYHEAPPILMQKAASAGLDIRDAVEAGKIHLHWRTPAELMVDEEFETLLELVERHRIKRLVIDAVEDLRQAVIPQSREVFVFSSLMNMLRARGVTSVVLQDISGIVGVNLDMPMAELSAIMDNALHLRYVERRGELGRLLAVLKVRARAHDHALREFQITPKGLSVGKAYERSEMALTGLGLPR